jgi:hypothetical protein
VGIGGSVFATTYNGAGTGLTGTASSLTAGQANALYSASTSNYQAAYTSATANSVAQRDGSGNLTANFYYGTAQYSEYADLAEQYTADAVYAAGTVVVFGGDEEITVSDISHDTRVAGVISTDPAYLMNTKLTNGLPVAFTGRVPCIVQGPVTKGDRLVNIQSGIAGRMDPALYEPGCIIGKSLENIETNEIKTIEVVVGRF